jgi:hypothetical protein
VIVQGRIDWRSLTLVQDGQALDAQQKREALALLKVGDPGRIIREVIPGLEVLADGAPLKRISQIDFQFWT